MVFETEVEGIGVAVGGYHITVGVGVAVGRGVGVGFAVGIGALVGTMVDVTGVTTVFAPATC